jgi:hypothetical protein
VPASGFDLVNPTCDRCPPQLIAPKRPSFLLDLKGRASERATAIQCSSMKFLVSLPGSAEIGLIRSRLEAAGIGCETRNEYLSPALPGAPFYPEVWVVKDEKFAEAKELLAAWRQPAPPSDTN